MGKVRRRLALDSLDVFLFCKEEKAKLMSDVKGFLYVMEDGILCIIAFLGTDLGRGRSSYP